VARIRVLSDEIVNRIAAGEVVERPSSVVKELVENSLDAGAKHVDVDLVNGGRSLIRVTDDGCGMDADDALLALERHATSKIASAGDLATISTLGFRGEALPSIAAIARMSLTTSEDPAAGGVRVVIEGGRVLAVEGTARPTGTTIEVRDLFFNTPARRKFLKTPETELRHAQDTLWAVALARPEVALTLRHGGRVLIEAPQATDIAERYRDLGGRRSGEEIRRFELRTPAVSASGLVASSAGSSRPQVFALVNGRPVHDRLLMGAVLRVLREAGSGLGKVRVVLLVEVAPEEVDVNVHPAKAEVRFARSGAVFSAVEQGLRQGIRASHDRVELGDQRPRAAFPPRVSEPAVGGWASPRQGALFPHPAYGEAPSSPSFTPSPDRESAIFEPPQDPQGSVFGRLIGQYRDSFLLLEDDQGLVIVDQHVAHERVLYDRVRRQLRGAAAASQGLLEPLVLELTEALAGAVDRVAGLLERIGLHIELFGADTVRVVAVPPELALDAVQPLVEELLERATELDGVPEGVSESYAHEMAASLACRSAITVNHRLDRVQQLALLNDLARTEDPFRCPHGRPIMLRLSQDEMERRLGRR
jgi:DNA mismatch repair protein MutL